MLDTLHCRLAKIDRKGRRFHFLESYNETTLPNAKWVKSCFIDDPATTASDHLCAVLFTLDESLQETDVLLTVNLGDKSTEKTHTVRLSDVLIIGRKKTAHRAGFPMLDVDISAWRQALAQPLPSQKNAKSVDSIPRILVTVKAADDGKPLASFDFVSLSSRSSPAYTQGEDAFLRWKDDKKEVVDKRNGTRPPESKEDIKRVRKNEGRAPLPDRQTAFAMQAQLTHSLVELDEHMADLQNQLAATIPEKHFKGLQRARQNYKRQKAKLKKEFNEGMQVNQQAYEHCKEERKQLRKQLQVIQHVTKDYGNTPARPIEIADSDEELLLRSSDDEGFNIERGNEDEVDVEFDDDDSTTVSVIEMEYESSDEGFEPTK